MGRGAGHTELSLRKILIRKRQEWSAHGSVSILHLGVAEVFGSTANVEVNRIYEFHLQTVAGR
jgi:hypothetical protein